MTFSLIHSSHSGGGGRTILTFGKRTGEIKRIEVGLDSWTGGGKWLRLLNKISETVVSENHCLTKIQGRGKSCSKKKGISSKEIFPSKIKTNLKTIWGLAGLL